MEEMTEVTEVTEMETSPVENNNALALVSPETQAEPQPKRRKKKSMVWEYFTIENVSPGCRRACCNRCKQSFAYSTGSKVAGTSHLKRHIAKGTCRAYLREQDNNQFSPYTPTDRCRLEIARMIIMHEYPLHMVEHPGFIAFVQNLQPRFDKVSFNTVQGDYMWTSKQTLGYVFITGHFIDFEWKLQRRVFNVIMEPYPDSDSALCHAVAACLSDCSYFEQHGKGCAWCRQEIVKKIRDSVKYVTTSESHDEKFVHVKNQLQVPSEKSLILDDQTQWNTTYQMLAAATELKEVFNCLDTSDPDYKLAPSVEDWKLAETLCTFLKPLFDAASILTTTTNPTAITFFHEAWKIHADLGLSITSEDPFISNLAKSMQEKIDKYWRDCSLILAIAVIMDPRFKMKLVDTSTAFDTDLCRKGNAGNGKADESHQGNLLLDQGLRISMSTLWRLLNKMKYPTLSKMARDILSIPVSAAAPDSVFDITIKQLDEYRSSLRPETVEALICAKDWLHYGSELASNALVKMEF
ncbi:Detected protein of confused Function [Hibiscus syriacus]|uniref:Detected protein of confused Function n=1 Tax=Hibiscus syriacus TaxID=106335 RepID=A0A6A2Y197_HIBSY|nr:Detected protein of confused Function [Hibiscus syriacus]